MSRGYSSSPQLAIEDAHVQWTRGALSPQPWAVPIVPTGRQISKKADPLLLTGEAFQAVSHALSLGEPVSVEMLNEARGGNRNFWHPEAIGGSVPDSHKRVSRNSRITVLIQQADNAARAFRAAEHAAKDRSTCTEGVEDWTQLLEELRAEVQGRTLDGCTLELMPDTIRIHLRKVSSPPESRGAILEAITLDLIVRVAVLATLREARRLQTESTTPEIASGHIGELIADVQSQVLDLLDAKCAIFPHTIASVFALRNGLDLCHEGFLVTEDYALRLQTLANSLGSSRGGSMVLEEDELQSSIDRVVASLCLFGCSTEQDVLQWATGGDPLAKLAALENLVVLGGRNASIVLGVCGEVLLQLQCTSHPEVAPELRKGILDVISRIVLFHARQSREHTDRLVNLSKPLRQVLNDAQEDERSDLTRALTSIAQSTLVSAALRDSPALKDYQALIGELLHEMDEDPLAAWLYALSLPGRPQDQDSREEATDKTIEVLSDRRRGLIMPYQSFGRAAASAIMLWHSLPTVKAATHNGSEEMLKELHDQLVPALPNGPEQRKRLAELLAIAELSLEDHTWGNLTVNQVFQDRDFARISAAFAALPQTLLPEEVQRCFVAGSSSRDMRFVCEAIRRPETYRGAISAALRIEDLAALCVITVIREMGDALSDSAEPVPVPLLTVESRSSDSVNYRRWGDLSSSPTNPKVLLTDILSACLGKDMKGNFTSASRGHFDAVDSGETVDVDELDIRPKLVLAIHAAVETAAAYGREDLVPSILCLVKYDDVIQTELARRLSRTPLLHESAHIRDWARQETPEPALLDGDGLRTEYPHLFGG